VIAYLGDGRIQSSDTTLNGELNSVLNLNEAFLVNNRKRVLDGFTRRLQRGILSTKTIQDMLADWSNAAGGELSEFCGVVIYWLNKKLARC
jgi:hypothetical protein